MDEAEPSPSPGTPEHPHRPAPGPRHHERREPAGRGDHPVVAGYDGSPSSRHALAYAVGLAARLHRPLLIVHVSPPSVYCEPMTGQMIGVPRDRPEMERWLLQELDEVCDRGAIEVRVTTRRGNPARELAAAADDTGADALVIGAPGHRWHHMAGSVPGWLARHPRCPIIVVP